MRRQLAWVALGLILSACQGGASSGVKRDPQDMNVSPRSMDAYDPAFRDLQKGGSRSE